MGPSCYSARAHTDARCVLISVRAMFTAIALLTRARPPEASGDIADDDCWRFDPSYGAWVGLQLCFEPMRHFQSEHFIHCSRFAHRMIWPETKMGVWRLTSVTLLVLRLLIDRLCLLAAAQAGVMHNSHIPFTPLFAVPVTKQGSHTRLMSVITTRPSRSRENQDKT
ncbi:hypothetical protein ABBQ32_14232 [Trebouxia sp. C0010 RCD-2024]